MANVKIYTLTGVLHNAGLEASSSHPGAGCSDPERLL